MPPIAMEMIAFSQPTESGARLARKWFGKESGWHVYAE
jgi:N-acetyltransferase